MMQNKRIAITGGIGSGKSLLCQFFREKGFAVFSCDEIYSGLLREPAYLSALSRAFPACFLGGKLQKEELARLVFSSAEEKRKLEELAHPLIMARLLQGMEEHSVSFAEVPLLFEGGFEELFDHVVVVVRNKEERIKAISQRDRLTREQILDRMKNQCNEEIYKQKNCIIVQNDGAEEALYEEGEKLLRLLFC